MSGASMDLKNRIATSIDLSDTLSILFLVDVARRLHVPKTMVLDWQQSGVFCGHEYVDGGNHQIYYLSDECDAFAKSDVFTEVVSNTFLRDLTGMDFGDLHVDSRAVTKWSPSGKSMRSMWNCRCKCGSELVVSSENLLTGRIDSCGCGMKGANKGASKYEFHVRQYLESIGLFEGGSDGYVQYKSYPDLVGVGGGYLLYDFYVICGDKEWLIECQGEQHYKSVAWFGGDAAFQVRKEHDRRKKEYAISHDISFVEIPHTCIQYDDVADLLAVSGLR